MIRALLSIQSPIPRGTCFGKSKARILLAPKHSAVTKLLDWAEKELRPITEEHEVSNEACKIMPNFDLSQVSNVIFSALQDTLRR